MWGIKDRKRAESTCAQRLITWDFSPAIKTPGICSIGSGDDAVSFDKGFEYHQGCGQWREPGGKEHKSFGESGRGGKRSTELQWEEQPLCPALFAVEERENRASRSSASSPPELCSGRGAAPAPLVPPIRPKIKKTPRFPHPVPPFDFFFFFQLSFPFSY